MLAFLIWAPMVLHICYNNHSTLDFLFRWRMGLILNFFCLNICNIGPLLPMHLFGVVELPLFLLWLYVFFKFYQLIKYTLATYALKED